MSFHFAGIRSWQIYSNFLAKQHLGKCNERGCCECSHVWEFLCFSVSFHNGFTRGFFCLGMSDTAKALIWYSKNIKLSEKGHERWLYTINLQAGGAPSSSSRSGNRAERALTLPGAISIVQDLGTRFKSNIKIHKIMETSSVSLVLVRRPSRTFLADLNVVP